MPYTLEEQKAHRQELVAALRSGEYTQSRNELRNSRGFCCLGVACDISELGKWRRDVEVGQQRYSVGDESPLCVLPKAVRDYYGFTAVGGEFVDGSLWKLNDKQGKSFFEIAQVIEDEPEGLVITE